MRTKTALIIITGIMVFLNIFMFISYNSLKNRHTKNSIYQNIKMSNNDVYNELFSYMTQSVLNKENKNMLLIKYPDIARKLNPGPKVVLYVQKDVCGSCLVDIFLDLEILVDRIGRDNIMILTNWDYNGKPMRSGDFTFDHYLVETLNMPIEKLNTPFLFVTDESFNTNLFFTPVLLPNINQEYFTKILPEYFNQN